MSQHLESSAVFSPNRQYRYELWRRWAPGKYCMFIGLNPSTANETEDDPTVRRCIRFAKDWGYDALCMTNIFAYRATDPRVMKAAAEPIGFENNLTLQKVAEGAGIVIAAWGVHGSHMERSVRVKSLLKNLHCLGTTKDGQPKHPLYLRADSAPVIFA